MTTDRDYDGPCKPDKHGKRGCPIWHCGEHRDRWPDYAVEATPGGSTIAEYDATDDFSRSIDEAYAAVRDRVAAGGPGWRPK